MIVGDVHDNETKGIEENICIISQHHPFYHKRTQTYLDGIDPIASDAPHFGSPGNQRQIVAIQKANKPYNAIGSHNGLEPATPRRIGRRWFSPRQPISVVNDIQQFLDFVLGIDVIIFSQKVREWPQGGFGIVTGFLCRHGSLLLLLQIRITSIIVVAHAAHGSFGPTDVTVGFVKVIAFSVVVDSIGGAVGMMLRRRANFGGRSFNQRAVKGQHSILRVGFVAPNQIVALIGLEQFEPLQFSDIRIERRFCECRSLWFGVRRRRRGCCCCGIIVMWRSCLPGATAWSSIVSSVASFSMHGVWLSVWEVLT